MEVLTVGALLEGDALVFPDKDALVQGSRGLSYAQLNEHANNLFRTSARSELQPERKVLLGCCQAPCVLASFFCITVEYSQNFSPNAR
ncbi:MAG: hypothetical protein AB1665_08450 [Candidatus Thermoplasmatota archaeon]